MRPIYSSEMLHQMRVGLIGTCHRAFSLTCLTSHSDPSNEKETSCVVNSISNLFVVDQEEDFLVDNGTFWVTPMVMSGSHYPISFSPSQEME
jgi:hypothetical protein